jgi:predicted SAM-dependent methyltransferase
MATSSRMSNSDALADSRGRKSERKGLLTVLREFIKSHTTYGLRQAIRQLYTESRVYLRHRSGIKQSSRFQNGKSLKLNIGCGPNRRPGWVNIDLFNPIADLQLDLRRPWPFQDGSVTYVYSEHMFEHFEYDQEVPHLLAESLRVLAEGGVFDVGVPDTEWPLQGYGNPDHAYWTTTHQWHPAECETQLDHINYHFRQGDQHKYAWDEESLTRSLRRAGFVDIARREFDCAVDTEARKVGTLYMRALKPRSVPA